MHCPARLQRAAQGWSNGSIHGNSSRHRTIFPRDACALKYGLHHKRVSPHGVHSVPIAQRRLLDNRLTVWPRFVAFLLTYLISAVPIAVYDSFNISQVSFLGYEKRGGLLVL
jgi:hypothetical protein|eukprot:4840691-Prymnesium_polylepis.1